MAIARGTANCPIRSQSTAKRRQVRCRRVISPHKDRRTEPDYVTAIEELLDDSVDLLLLHDGPDHPEPGFRGCSAVRASLESRRPLLTIRGHAHWPRSLVGQPNGGQVLNADAQVFILSEGTRR
jgi:hypothetical protein